MKALRCANSRVELITDAPVPEPKNGEVLIKVRMAGICRTDLELSKGYMGFEGILGHEFVGETVNEIPGMRFGTRVVGEINAGCGSCPSCYQGMQRHCPNRSVLGILNRNGCMAEFLTLPPENILAVPSHVADEEAVFTEPLAAALEIFEQLRIEPSHRVCIIGDGKLGMLIAMVFAHKHDGETMLVGHHQSHLDLLSDQVKLSLENDVNSHENNKWDIVIEATGSTAGLQRAMLMVKPRGTIVLKSTMAHPQGLDLSPIVIDEITVVGSRCGRFAPALNLLAKQHLPVTRLIEQVFPLNDALSAWDAANHRGAKKILLAISL